MMHASGVIILAGLSVFALSTEAHGQQRSVSDALTSLLLATQDGSATAADRDLAAAAATRDTLSQLLLVELGTQPTTASAGGFAYRFDPELGTRQRVSNSFGPFYSERASRDGKGQAALGLSVRYADFNSIQGRSLTDGTHPSRTEVKNPSSNEVASVVVSEVSPATHDDALSRAFAQLKAQTMELGSCDLSIATNTATVVCVGRTRVVRRVGSAEPVIDAGRWTFRLRRGGETWRVDSVAVVRD